MNLGWNKMQQLNGIAFINSSNVVVGYIQMLPSTHKNIISSDNIYLITDEDISVGSQYIQ
jgi:hypothetical protein